MTGRVAQAKVMQHKIQEVEEREKLVGFLLMAALKEL